MGYKRLGRFLLGKHHSVNSRQPSAEFHTRNHTACNGQIITASIALVILSRPAATLFYGIKEGKNIEDRNEEKIKGGK